MSKYLYKCLLNRSLFALTSLLVVPASGSAAASDAAFSIKGEFFSTYDYYVERIYHAMSSPYYYEVDEQFGTIDREMYHIRSINKAEGSENYKSRVLAIETYKTKKEAVLRSQNPSAHLHDKMSGYFQDAITYGNRVLLVSRYPVRNVQLERNEKNIPILLIELKKYLAVKQFRPGPRVSAVVPKLENQEPPKVQGGLTIKQVIEVRKKGFAQLAKCYQIHNGGYPMRQSRDSIFALYIARSGAVSKLSLGTLDDSWPDLRDCIEKTLKVWKFPSAKKSTVVEGSIRY